jgi:hypothetical protein
MASRFYWFRFYWSFSVKAPKKEKFFNSEKLPSIGGGFAQGEIAQNLTLNILTRVIVTTTNCFKLLRDTILHKTHNSSQDLQ